MLAVAAAAAGGNTQSITHNSSSVVHSASPSIKQQLHSVSKKYTTQPTMRILTIIVQFRQFLEQVFVTACH